MELDSVVPRRVLLPLEAEPEPLRPVELDSVVPRRVLLPLDVGAEVL